MTHQNELADRYVSLWNEPDPERRRELLGALWAENGAQLLQSPAEIREIAARPGIGMTARLEALGHAELEARVASAYGEWVERGGFRFRHQGNADRVADVVKFNWEMVDAEDTVAAVGLTVLVLGPDGRIARDYQFIER
jgi:hypothetical protein